MPKSNMHNILVAISDQPSDKLLIQYAAGLFNSKTTLTLAHIFPLPVIPTEGPAVIFPIEDFRVEKEEKIKELISLHSQSFPEVNFKSYVQGDINIANAIGEASENIKADLIVIGVSSSEDDQVFGNMASSLIDSGSTPVMAIPVESDYTSFNKITLAFDFDVAQLSTLKLLKELLVDHPAELRVVNVLEDDTHVPDIKQATLGVQLESILEGIKHTFHFPVNKDVIIGLEEFVDHYPTDLLVMIHHPKGFLQRLFSTQHTREIFDDLNIPVLVLKG